MSSQCLPARSFCLSIPVRMTVLFNLWIFLNLIRRVGPYDCGILQF